MSKEIQPVESQSPQLILGQDSIKKASVVAKQLTQVLENLKLYSIIENKKFIMVEGWTTLGAMLSVFPEVVSVDKQPEKTVTRILVGYEYWDKFTRQMKKATRFITPSAYDPSKHTIIPDANGNQEREIEEIKYRAIVRLRSVNGTVITKAEAICSNAETGKLANDEYSIASMAQTRATGKAFRLAFAWIVKMAGYEPTPAEEVTEGMVSNGNGNGGYNQQAEPEQPKPKVENKLKLK